jgi:hypothetical protein
MNGRKNKKEVMLLNNDNFISLSDIIDGGHRSNSKNSSENSQTKVVSYNHSCFSKKFVRITENALSKTWCNRAYNYSTDLNSNHEIIEQEFTQNTGKYTSSSKPWGKDF